MIPKFKVGERVIAKRIKKLSHIGNETKATFIYYEGEVVENQMTETWFMDGNGNYHDVPLDEPEEMYGVKDIKSGQEYSCLPGEIYSPAEFEEKGLKLEEEFS